MQDEVMNDIHEVYADPHPEDLVRVTRCKDCAEANYANMCGLVNFWNMPTDFCSRGTPKEKKGSK